MRYTSDETHLSFSKNLLSFQGNLSVTLKSFNSQPETPSSEIVCISIPLWPPSSMMEILGSSHFITL